VPWDLKYSSKLTPSLWWVLLKMTFSGIDYLYSNGSENKTEIVNPTENNIMMALQNVVDLSD
ncbi:30183_t:CDS:2, partial [Racocetra persica]